MDQLRHYYPPYPVRLAGMASHGQESSMPVALALYQPDIPNNTGTLIRLGACLGTTIHIIHPTGFPFSRKTLARAGLDYLDYASVQEHDSWTKFNAWRTEQSHRLVLLTTKALQSAYQVEYTAGDILMVGRESAGVPAEVAGACDVTVRIPMRPDLRSINVALAATLILGEAKRQTDGFTELQ